MLEARLWQRRNFIFWKQRRSFFSFITLITVLKNILTTYIPNLRMKKAKIKSQQMMLPPRSTCRRSVPPRDKLFTENRQNATSQKHKYAFCGSIRSVQISTYAQNTDFANEIQPSFFLMPPYSFKTRFTVEQKI